MLLTLCAFFALLFGIPAASMSSAATTTGYVRVGNLSETTAPVDVYLYASGDSSPQVVVRDIAYGVVSGYNQIPAGSYTVKMLTAGDAASAQPLLSASLTVQAGHSYTVAAFTVAGQGRQAKVLDDSLTTPSGKSLVRVIQASINQKDLTFHCSCAPGAAGNLMSKGTTGAVSAYIPIPANTWTMTATGPTANTSLPVTLVAGTVHTEVVIDTPSGIQIENLVDAAGSGQPPLGGIGTGFGGTAGHGPGSLLPWLAVIGAGVLLALAGGFRLRRRGVRIDEPRPLPTRM
jgi:hypothetical protein